FSRIDEVGGSSVDPDNTRTGFAFDDIGLKPCSGRGADDEDFFPDPETGRLDQLPVDCDAADIIDIGLGDGGEVNFGSEEAAHEKNGKVSQKPTNCKRGLLPGGGL